MVMVHFFGRIAVLILENGSMANNMEAGFLRLKQGNHAQESGRAVIDSGGRSPTKSSSVITKQQLIHEYLF
jgi:hypothetical protein